MAMLLFKGETLKVRVTHNVLSEMIRLNELSYQDAIKLSGQDPMGWTRDIVYCSLRVYNPEVLGEMSKYEVGDEIFEKLPPKELQKLLNDLLEDFVQTTMKGQKKVASEKK